MFDSDEVIDSEGLPDGYTEYLPGETQITWRVLGFREDSPYNAVMEFSDGVIPLLYVPLTPDAVSQFKGAMDQVYAAQNGMPLPASEDSHFIQDLEDALTEDEEVVLDENGDPVKPRMQSWKTWREVQVGSLKATVKEPGNRSSWVFAGIMVVSFVLLGACTLINAAVQ